MERSWSPPTPVSCHPPTYTHMHTSIGLLITIPSNDDQATEVTIHTHIHCKLSTHTHSQNQWSVLNPKNTSTILRNVVNKKGNTCAQHTYTRIHTLARTHAWSPWKQAGEWPVPLSSVDRQRRMRKREEEWKRCKIQSQNSGDRNKAEKPRNTCKASL